MHSVALHAPPAKERAHVTQHQVEDRQQACHWHRRVARLHFNSEGSQFIYMYAPRNPEAPSWANNTHARGRVHVRENGP